jgi:hypothetical protein
MGFDIMNVSEDAKVGLGILNFPGIEKRTSEFTKNASAEEMLMVFVQSGTAKLTEGMTIDGEVKWSEDSAIVKEGQMVTIDGEVKWSELSEGGLTLLSSTFKTDVLDDDASVQKGMFSSLNPFSSLQESFSSAQASIQDPETILDKDGDLTIMEVVGLLARGIGLGTILVFLYIVVVAGDKIFSGGSTGT